MLDTITICQTVTPGTCTIETQITFTAKAKGEEDSKKVFQTFEDLLGGMFPTRSITYEYEFNISAPDNAATHDVSQPNDHAHFYLGLQTVPRADIDSVRKKEIEHFQKSFPGLTRSNTHKANFCAWTESVPAERNYSEYTTAFTPTQS